MDYIEPGLTMSTTTLILASDWSQFDFLNMTCNQNIFLFNQKVDCRIKFGRLMKLRDLKNEEILDLGCKNIDEVAENYSYQIGNILTKESEIIIVTANIKTKDIENVMNDLYLS